MALTVTERQHWEDRIAKRINRAIDAVYSGDDPGFLERLETEAREVAAKRLGILKLQKELKENERAKKLIEKKNRDLSRQLVASIRKCDPSEVTLSSYYGGLPPKVDQAIERCTAIVRDELLAADVLGKRILDLRREEEELLDTVWLATSGSQIKELWQSVTARLDQSPTALQSEALQIPPEKCGTK